MFTLRKVIDNIQSNQKLGDDYQVVERETNYDEFCKAYEKFFEKNHVADLDDSSDNYSQNCYAFILHYGGSKITPLYKKQYNYIMSENGKTFSNLTYK